MSQTAAAPTSRTDNFQSRYLDAYRWMLLARIAEDKVATLYRGGKIVGGVFLGKGQEAIEQGWRVGQGSGEVGHHAPIAVQGG